MPKILKVAENGCIASTKKDISQKKSTKSIENQDVNTFYVWKGTHLNPNYAGSLVPLDATKSGHCLRSCSYHNKSDIFGGGFVTDEPKWITYLDKYEVNQHTGEVSIKSSDSDNLRSFRYRKHLRINAFNEVMKPLYRRKKISLFFAAVTLANEVQRISVIMDLIKKRIKRNGFEVVGYLWAFEVGTGNEDNPTGKHHLHYHILLATTRINIKGGTLPNFLKLDNITKRRTSITFVSGRIQTKTGKWVNAYNYYVNAYINKKSPKFIPNEGRIRHFGCGLNEKLLSSLWLS